MSLPYKSPNTRLVTRNGVVSLLSRLRYAVMTGVFVFKTTFIETGKYSLRPGDSFSVTYTARIE